jgi:hypothetical protein
MFRLVTRIVSNEADFHPQDHSVSEENHEASSNLGQFPPKR